MKDMWNQRYAEKDYAYGKDANSYFKEELNKLQAGKILFPAEGEGRNAVYAAKAGWDVYAFDFSESAKLKALKLADENNVDIKYDLSTIDDYQAEINSFDCIVFVFAHTPAEKRQEFHHKMISLLKPGGKIILEGFSKDQLNYNSGGPKMEAMLFDEEMIRNDFSLLKKIDVEQTLCDLSEGEFHKGQSSVIRMTATK